MKTESETITCPICNKQRAKRAGFAGMWFECENGCHETCEEHDLQSDIEKHEAHMRRVEETAKWLLCWNHRPAAETETGVVNMRSAVCIKDAEIFIAAVDERSKEIWEEKHGKENVK